MTSLLTADQLSLPPRLHQVSLQVARGEVLGLLGVNGAGKSTLLSLLAGARQPLSGSIRLDQQPLHSAAARHRIGWLPQQPPLYPEMTVLENLRFACQLNTGTKPGTAQIDALLDEFSLGALGQRLAHRLSGGERMRLGLACCLSHRPDLLLLDEPSAGLDPLQAQQLRELIASLSAERAVVIASHLLPDIEQLCQRALLLDRGRVVAEQPLQHDRQLWWAEFEQPPDDAALLALDGIAAVTERQAARITLRLHPTASPTLAEQLASRGWGLRRWQPAEADLSARFRALSSGECT